MNEFNLWINRFITMMVCVIVVIFLEKYNVRPYYCFIITCITIIGLAIVVEIINHLWRKYESSTNSKHNGNL